mgnify:CR=1 FL=1
MGNDSGLKISIVIERATKIEIKRYFNDYIFVASSNISYSARQKWGIIILLFLIVVFIGMKHGTNLRTNY